MKTKPDASSVILVAVLALASLVRLIGIRFGLPYVFYPDESLIVNHAMAFGTGDLNPHFFIYPSLLMYVNFFVFGVIYVVGLVTGAFAGADDFIRLFFTNATPFYLPGRLMSALSGIVSVWLVYKLGARIYTRRVGLVASAVLTFAVLHVEFSHYVKTHVPAGLLVVIALWLAWRIVEGKDTLRNYVLAGAASGLAASTIYHAGFVLVSVILAHVLRWSVARNDNGAGRILDLRIGAAIAVSAVTFALTTPYALLDWPNFVSELTSTSKLFQEGGFWEHGTFYPLTSLIPGFGMPLGIIVILGMGYVLLRRRAGDLVVASQPLFLVAFLMLFRVKEPHHMLIAYPALAILAGAFLVESVEWLVRRNELRKGLAVVAVTLALIVLPAAESLRFGYEKSLPDTRVLAKRWIEGNIPEGSRIAMYSGKYYLGALSPPLKLNREAVQRLIDRGRGLAWENLAKRDGTRRVGYPGEAAYFAEQLKTLADGEGYDVIQIIYGTSSADRKILTYEDYLQLGVQYVITSSYATEQDRQLAESAGSSSEAPDRFRRELSESLRAKGILLSSFEPEAGTYGPAISIYKIH